ncbi:MAG: terminase large subunit [Clostridium sp.]|nr:terminase large subunit [Clostridium sp.]
MNNSYILEYYNFIKSGECIVGRELLLQLETLVKEISDPIYQKTGNIIVDFTESEKRIKFIQEKCKHFEAPHAGKPFILEIWQKAFIEAIFAIKIYDEEVGKYIRKYRDVLFLVGRKNGKTPLISAINLSEWFCGPTGLKILCASNDDNQADLMFQAINAMREESPSLEKVTKKNNKGIFFGNPKQKKKKGKFSAQNKGSIRKLSAKTGAKEGRNIGIGAVDEVFEMKDDTTVMPIRQALSTQDEPLYFELTTEGFTMDGYLDQRLKEARQVLNGELYRPRWLIWLYTQDSEAEVWQDERNWLKSNPGLGVIKKWSFLRDMIEESKTSNSKRAFVLAKDFNIKQNTGTAWLQEGDIINNTRFELEQFRGWYYIGGVDISETTDLTSARAMFIDPNTMNKYTVTMYFVPESKADEKLSLENDTNREKKNYREWAKKGMVTIIPGTEVDQSYIVKWFYKLYEDYGMLPYRVGYDNWHAKDFIKMMAQYFGDEITERIAMDKKVMSNPMRIVEADLKAKKLIYNNDIVEENEMDIWCLRNTAIKVDDLGQIMPVKVRQSFNRIDGALSFIICQATYSMYKSDYLSLMN